MPEEDDLFFREITAGMAGGDESSYRLFFERCFDRLCRHLLVKTRGNESLARELAQIVLLRVVKYIKPFAGERVFWSWLYQICRSVHVDWVRANNKTSTQEWIEIEVEAAAPLHEADQELLDHLDDSLQALEPKEKELVRLAYFEAVPQATIAKQLQSTPKAVESRLARIRRKLRHMIIKKLRAYALF